ncbi:MAG: polysaccharide biosynthesis tyrosine autokinase [Desulfobacterales bacterium]
MSKLSKALDKYKKERNLTSARILDLDEAKKPESELKKGASRSIRARSNADTAKQRPRSSTPQNGSGDVTGTALREVSRSEAETFFPQPTGRDKPLEKQAQPAIANKDKAPHLKGDRIDAGSAATEPVGISLDRVDPNLVSVVNPQSMETEIFKVLRGKILFPASGKPPRSIMVTSAVPGEGKSFVASNLAVNMAQNIEDHVLLMDCDLRRPTIHRIFGLGQVKGLSDHLSNGNKIPELLIKTGLGKLSIFPSGAPPHNPSEVLSSTKMANLLEELKTRYEDRFIIIESPPPMLAPETSAIAKQVDAIIVVIRFGSTPMDAVEELIDTLGKEKIIGAVINRFDARPSRYYGYKKYGKYYRS